MQQLLARAFIFSWASRKIWVISVVASLPSRSSPPMVKVLEPTAISLAVSLATSSRMMRKVPSFTRYSSTASKACSRVMRPAARSPR